MLEDLANGRPKPDCYSLFIFVFVFGGSRDQFPGATSSLRSDAGLGGVLDDVLDESGDGDVEDELVPELDDNPGITIGTKFSVLHSLVWSTVVVYCWPTHRYVRFLRRTFQVMELQACHRVVALSRRDQHRERILVLPPFVCTTPLAVTTTVGIQGRLQSPHFG